MGNRTKRQRFCGRPLSQDELRHISLFGTEQAWLKAADKTPDPNKWKAVLKELRPWAHQNPSLCRVHVGQIVLISRIYVRLPDPLNGLKDATVERTCVDYSKNPLVDRTEWIYLKGNERAGRPTWTYPQKRKCGMPRKKAIAFD